MLSRFESNLNDFELGPVSQPAPVPPQSEEEDPTSSLSLEILTSESRSTTSEVSQPKIRLQDRAVTEQIAALTRLCEKDLFTWGGNEARRTYSISFISRGSMASRKITVQKSAPQE